MYIKKDYGFNDLKDNSWSGAIPTIERIEKENKEEELMDFLEDLYFDSAPTETEVNDLLWFDADYIYETLGIHLNNVSRRCRNGEIVGIHDEALLVAEIPHSTRKRIEKKLCGLTGCRCPKISTSKAISKEYEKYNILL